MKTTHMLCGLGVALAVGVAGATAEAQVPASPLADRCATAQRVSPGTVIRGDLTGARNDSGERIAATGYTWEGRDHFFAIVLRAGQTVTLGLVEDGGWDGGIYVFTSCSAINATTVGGLDTSASTPFRFTAPATGRYIIAVDAWRPNTGAGYVLSISR